MAKRTVDTGMWEKPWFRSMPVVQKAAWMYVLLKCDFVGVWDADTEMADFVIGSKVDWEALRNECNDNIEVLENGKWWVVDYCSFNYGNIDELSKSSLQRAVHSRLVNKGLWEKYLDRIQCRVSLPYTNPTRRVNSNSKKEQEQVQDKEQDKDKDKDKELYHAVEAAFLSRNGDRFTNFGKEGKAIHGLIEKARGRLPDDPGAMLHAMLDAFWKLKAGDTSAKGFWRGQPFLPSALSPLWDRVLETMREDVVSPELLAIVNGGKT
jgi:hypothetical protein